jgi:hypothetical protein
VDAQKPFPLAFHWDFTKLDGEPRYTSDGHFLNDGDTSEFDPNFETPKELEAKYLRCKQYDKNGVGGGRGGGRSAPLYQD